MKAEKGYKFPTYDIYIENEIVDVAEALGLGWVFRGQADASWSITSSLEREMTRMQNKNPDEYESNVLKQAKRAMDFTECRQLDGKDDFSWLAMLQHHGCKTRLVDFTESFYVALYFAIRDLHAVNDVDPGQDAVVWAISKFALDGNSIALCEKNNWELDQEEMSRRLLNNAIDLPWRYDKETDGTFAVVCSKPGTLNQRMIAQQGLFLAPLNLKHPFEENLIKGLKLHEILVCNMEISTLDDLKNKAALAKAVKICIPKKLHKTLLFHLKRMNLSEATLFPGLDGYARSLNYYAADMEMPL